MGIVGRIRRVLIMTAAALLPACTGSQTTPALSSAKQLQRTDAHGRDVFAYTGGKQTFEVPSGVMHVTVIASGASGGLSYSDAFGAAGGEITAKIAVTPGETLRIYVGGAGGEYQGGFNGGADPGERYAYSSGILGGGGGGGSDVRQGGDKLRDRVVVAGGGGGQGCCYRSGRTGGLGGGANGGAGASGWYSGCGGAGGKGGKQKAGGRGGAGGYYGPYAGGRGVNGSLRAGGHGGSGVLGGPGGGGGGGYYGGGGGGGGCGPCGSSSYACDGGGGGGGSSYAEQGAVDVKDRNGGAAPGNGKVVITW